MLSKEYRQSEWNEIWIERKEKTPHTLMLQWRKDHIHTKILSELEKNLFKGKKVISFGCGSGELEVIFATKGHSIIGVDISNEALQIAKKHKEDEKLDNVHFIQASIHSLPFHRSVFDAGYMIELLEHTSANEMEKIFSETKRVLKDNSNLFIIVPNGTAYYHPKDQQVFTKYILKNLLNRLNLNLIWINLEERKDKYRKHSMIKAMIINKKEN